MKQSYSIILYVSLALITASFRPSSSFDLHEEESRREPLLERSPPSRFSVSRDHGRPRDDHRSPPPPPPKSDHRLEHNEDREDADDDDDDVEDDIRSEHHPSFRRYRKIGSDASRISGIERDGHGNDLRPFDGRDEDGSSPRTPFNRMLDGRRPPGGEERHLGDELEWLKTGDPDSRDFKEFPDKKRGLFDELEGDDLIEKPEKENDDRNEDDLWGRPPFDDRNRKYDSSRRRPPSISDRHRVQQKLHYGAIMRTPSGKPRPSWRTKVDYNSFDDKKKRAL